MTTQQERACSRVPTFDFLIFSSEQECLVVLSTSQFWDFFHSALAWAHDFNLELSNNET